MIYRPIAVYQGEDFEFELIFESTVEDVKARYLHSDGKEFKIIDLVDDKIHLTAEDTKEASHDTYGLEIMYKKDEKVQKITKDRFITIVPNDFDYENID